MLRKIGYGLVLWVVPYVLSIPLLPLQDTNLAVFKASIISIAMVVSAVVLVLYFKKDQDDYLKDAVVTAALWLVLNIIIDIIALLPFTKQTFPEYFMEIGIEYVAFTAIVIAVGYLLQRKLKR